MIAILSVVAGILAFFVVFAIAFTLFGLHRRKQASAPGHDDRKPPTTN
jgi:hypothetical protein